MTTDTLTPPDTTARLARALGPGFDVVRLLGRGGFAEVYEVVDTELRRRLAVKVLRPDLPWGSRTVARFLQEARTLARLNHPHTLPIYFVAEGEGLVYYAMPYLDGASLGEILRREGPQSVARTLALALPIVDALRHAHEHGIVHRDVKPENIVVEASTGRPLLVDFGIARSLDGEGHHTEAGFVVGTPLYMSPEQALGRPDVDPRADLYAVGAVLFEMLTGRPPFVGADSQEIVGHHLTQPVPVAAISGDDVPLWLRGIIVRCLAKRPDDRYPSAAALLTALRDREMPTGMALEAPTMTDAVLADAGAGPDGAGPRTPHDHPHRGAAHAQTVQLPRRRPRWRVRLGGLVGLSALAAAGATGVGYRPDVTLVAENRLLAPVSLAIGDQSFLLEPGGDRIRVPVPRGRRLEAHWALVQPTARDGRTLGETLDGAFITARPTDSLVMAVTAERAAHGQRSVAPLVVNETPHAVSVTVVTASDSVDCGCFISPGDSLAVGYYALSAATAVRVTDVLGRTARIGGLDTLVQPGSGQARVPVDSAALRRPTKQ